jgi:hypothetical protein
MCIIAMEGSPLERGIWITYSPENSGGLNKIKHP